MRRGKSPPPPDRPAAFPGQAEMIDLSGHFLVADKDKHEQLAYTLRILVKNGRRLNKREGASPISMGRASGTNI